MTNERYRLGFHIAPKTGWLNDPNGLCQFRGVYHAFFQFNPVWPQIDTKYWRHFTSTDLVHWKDCGTPLVTDIAEDRNGVYSGSACVRRGMASDGGDLMCLYYTGNVVYKDDPEAGMDFVHTGREANEILVTSEDGEHFSEKNVLLRNSDYPNVCTLHVRDPKVWEQDGRVWMLLGARDQDDEGMVLLYGSDDGRTWRIKSQVYSQNKFGYMWECPNIVQIDGHDFLAVCPQGLPDEVDRWQNLWQAGYFPLEGSILDTVLVDETTFVEWDLGYDFYAPQVFVDDSGRTILIGWMGTFEDNRTSSPNGMMWAHCLTVPRVLTIGENGLLRQNPASELETMRGEAIPLKASRHVAIDEHRGDIVIDGINGVGALALDDNAVEIAYTGEKLEVSFGNAEVAGGRIDRQVPLDHLDDLRVMEDTSAIEIYANVGETVFSTRWFPTADMFKVEASFKSERAVMYPLEDAMADAYVDSHVM
ncbi:MAG: glycoside hydrolase family 32 protein [Atopobiaceae bacterium]|nr:glycoside hydrolase family 32 protein [Atopobiaceae bacterium]